MSSAGATVICLTCGVSGGLIPARADLIEYVEFSEERLKQEIASRHNFDLWHEDVIQAVLDECELTLRSFYQIFESKTGESFNDWAKGL